MTEKTSFVPEGFAPYELVEGVIKKLPETSEAIWKDIQEVKRIVREVREELKPKFIRINMESVPQKNIGAIDGSNSPPKPRMGWTFGTYSAVCYYAFKKKPEIFSNSAILPNFTGIGRYLSLLRFKEELKMIPKAAEKTDILLFNGSYIPIFWAYRKVEVSREFSGFEEYPPFEDLYDKVIESESGIFKKDVVPFLKKHIVVAVPEFSFSKYFIMHELKYYNVPRSFSDQVLLTVTLEEKECTEPIPYFKTLSKSDQERLDRVHKEMKDFYIAYLKPHKNAPAIKIEFHKNHVKNYEEIVKVLMDHYDPLTKQIQPLWMAHNISNMVSALSEQTAEMAKKVVVDKAKGDNRILEFIECSFLPSRVAKMLDHGID